MRVNHKRVALVRVGECITEGRLEDLEVTVLRALDMGIGVEIVAQEIARAWKSSGERDYSRIAEWV